ncbi:MAG: hypothetical protein IPH51_22725 [Rubrivivax sp.]|nr:hypothetical protein [Rubrivivax sp.]
MDGTTLRSFVGVPTIVDQCESRLPSIDLVAPLKQVVVESSQLLQAEPQP